MENNTKNNLKNQLKLDLKSFAITTLIITLIFIGIFYKENILKTIWVVLSFLLTFTLPGFILCYLWYDQLDFLERFIISNMLGLISVGILSYNISIYTGINIKIISIITPIIVAIIYGLIIYFSEKNKDKQIKPPSK